MSSFAAGTKSIVAVFLLYSYPHSRPNLQRRVVCIFVVPRRPRWSGLQRRGTWKVLLPHWQHEIESPI